MEPKARVLLNEDGTVFSDLHEVAPILEQLSDAARKDYRDENSTSIANSTAKRLLAVSGPGAGKSHLFLGRIEHWAQEGGAGKIRVASFVRKLVADLKVAVAANLSREDQVRVEVTTLHTLARSVLEKSGGTMDLVLGAHIRIIDSESAWMVWDDVLEYHPKLRGVYHLDELQRQFRTETYDKSDEWEALHATYRDLCSFFNAVGFEYLIVLAREAVDQNPDIVDADHWIFDEYQDFNYSEDHLVRSLTARAAGILIAGDDDQALYQQLKDSHPDILVGYYRDGTYANAMLPFCSRSSYYICVAAAAFIAKHRAPDSIAKVFLPLRVDKGDQRIQMVATWAPSSAVAYIEKFLADHEAELSEHLERRKAGTDTDPFLLILAPGGKDWRKRCGYADVETLVAEHATGLQPPSGDYLAVVLYARAGWHETDNFAIRKVMHAEGITTSEAHELIVDARKRGTPLWVVVEERRAPIIQKVRAVVYAVEKLSDQAEELVAQLENLIKLDDRNALVKELQRNPIKRSTRADEQDEPIETAGMLPPVALMTIVGAKGLSARHVIVLGCDDVNLKVKNLAFFVALTRARESLHLMISAHSGGAKQAHKFLSDLPAECCNCVTYKKTNGAIEGLDGLKALHRYFEKIAWVASRW